MDSVAAFEQKWKELKDADGKKAELVDELLAQVAELTETLEDTKLQLEREKDTSRMFHLRDRNTKAELENKQKQIFLDEYVKNIDIGGQLAAQHLRDATLNYIKAELPDLNHDIKILVRVYANMKGLSKLYCDANILDHREQFEKFTRSFNMSHSLCDFVDAGNGKECSDDKIRELFKLHVDDLHCKHIIFGGSADNGYARMLGPYSGTEDVCKRVTMIEGPPFAQELARDQDSTSKSIVFNYPAAPGYSTAVEEPETIFMGFDCRDSTSCISPRTGRSSANADAETGDSKGHSSQ
ncbi:MAG: hypothetical protein Q9218_006989 [Villophora microphyllina]